MRSIQFAGKASNVNPARLYNCSYLAMNDYRAFSEMLFLLLSGVGCGFSAQDHHVNQLPEIRKPNKKIKRRYLINDSISG
jgi:ribonucleoside-diphosphate reductase alpha chain